jgi:hypothetical protein
VSPAWDGAALAASPRFAVLHTILAELPAGRAPTLDDLNAAAACRGLANASGQPIRFVAADGKGDYEGRIAASGEVPMRAGTWHDLFNALAWLAFPVAKAALNRLHAEHRVPGERGTARDVLTLFDEDGLVLLTADSTLGDLLRAFQWRRLLVERRADVRRDTRFLVFGHALHEKLLAPFRGLTAKVLVIEVEPAALAAPAVELLRRVDLETAAAMAPALVSTRALAPLPVQGIPGWWPANEDPAFYDDTGQFRPGRRK